MEVHPYAALAYSTAMVFHNLTNATPQRMYALVSTQPELTALPPDTQPEDWAGLRLVRGRTPAMIGSQQVTWVRVAPERYSGVWEYHPYGHGVRVTTPERTLVDGLLQPEYCGGIENVFEAWERARDTLDLNALTQLVDHLQIGVLRQRVGFILDELRLPHPRVEQWQAATQRGGSSRLVASAPYASHYSARWNLSINAPVDALTTSP